MLVFSNSPGVVGTMITGDALPFAVVMGGSRNAPIFPRVSSAKAILTGYRLTQRSGLGISHTLRDRIYATVFGERAGKAQVSGIAFAGICTSNSRWTGFDAVQAYYENVRASSSGAPVRLVFGPQTTLFGLMRGLDYSFEDANTGIGTFSFEFDIMPRGSAVGVRPPLPWIPFFNNILTGPTDFGLQTDPDSTEFQLQTGDDSFLTTN